MILQLFCEQEEEARPQVQLKQLQVLTVISVQGSDVRRLDVGRGDRDNANVTGEQGKAGERHKDGRMQDRENETEGQAGVPNAKRTKVLSLYINKLH